MHDAQENKTFKIYTEMTEQQKQAIIESGKQYFRSLIIPDRLENLDEISLDSLGLEAYFFNYLSTFIKEDSQFVELAKALVYPCIFDMVFETCDTHDAEPFVSQLQGIIGGASDFDGIDFEFIDTVDGRHKYCLLKAGVESVDVDDLVTIFSHFKPVVSQPGLDLHFEDLLVGVLFGREEDLCDFYMIIDSQYPVLCGKKFWKHLTGDSRFYARLHKAMVEVLDEEELEVRELIQAKIEQFVDEIKFICGREI